MWKDIITYSNVVVCQGRVSNMPSIRSSQLTLHPPWEEAALDVTLHKERYPKPVKKNALSPPSYSGKRIHGLGHQVIRSARRQGEGPAEGDRDIDLATEVR